MTLNKKVQSGSTIRRECLQQYSGFLLSPEQIDSITSNSLIELMLFQFSEKSQGVLNIPKLKHRSYAVLIIYLGGGESRKYLEPGPVGVANLVAQGEFQVYLSMGSELC